MKNFTLLLTFLALLCACTQKSDQPKESAEKEPNSKQPAMTVEPFGTMPDGRSVNAYTLDNGKGMTIKVINYGGIIVSLSVPDRNGKSEDVVLGYDSLSAYIENNPYFGALIGRYGNRIAKGKFTLDGKQYTLAVNNGPNHLHGGLKGFDKVFWEIEERKVDNGVSLKLNYASADMEEGYPGKLNVEVWYTLTTDNELQIEYQATTDKTTIVNLTQHSYFNLTGMKSDILKHELTINADTLVEVDKTLIPTGKLSNVANTPFDFRQPTSIGSRINEKDPQLQYGNGYDHCWALKKSGEKMTKAAVLYDSTSGREMTVYTTEPGIQFYSGNFLDGSNKGKGKIYEFRTGLCLETEHYPDSPNQSGFPNVVLKPGETYRTSTTYKFSVRK